MKFFKNYDSFVIVVLGCVTVVLSCFLFYFNIEYNIIFLTGFGMGWICVGFMISQEKFLSERYWE